LIRYTERLLDEADANGDGRLQQAEWSDRLLDRYDHNGDRRLGPDEWAPTAIAKYDRNGDGSLEEAEWRRIWIGQGLPRDDAGATAEQLVRVIAKLGGGKPIVLKQSHLGETLRPLPLLSRAAATGARAADRAAPDEGPATTSPFRKLPPKPARGGRRANTKFFVPRSQLPRGLPPWFVVRDANGDRQLTMAEYAPKATQSQAAEFARYDWNRDGLVTAEECARGLRPIPGEMAKETEEAAREPAETPGEQAVEGAAEEAADQPGEPTNESPDEAAEAAAARAAALKKLRLQKKARSRNRSKKPSQEATSAGGN
jgi:hypothetical protein